MDRLHLMTVFVAVAEAQSFAAAARRLAMSPPAVTRGSPRPEARLGVKPTGCGRHACGAVTSSQARPRQPGQLARDAT